MGSRKKKNCFFCGQTKKLWEKKNTTKVSGELEGGGLKVLGANLVASLIIHIISTVF